MGIKHPAGLFQKSKNFKVSKVPRQIFQPANHKIYVEASRFYVPADWLLKEEQISSSLPD